MARSADATSGHLHERAQDPVGSDVTTVSHTAEIIAAYVGSHRIAPDALPGFVQDVHRALLGLGQNLSPSPGSASQEPLKPAVPVSRSRAPDRLTCLVCGEQLRTLARHIGAAHGLSPEAYRQAFRLPQDYALVATETSARQSAGSDRRWAARKTDDPPSEGINTVVSSAGGGGAEASVTEPDDTGAERARPKLALRIAP